MQSITLRFSSRASLGALADKNCKRMLRSKKRHITIIRRVARSRTATEMNEAIKNLKNSEFWKIEKFQNYMMKYWLPLTEVSKVDMLLYGEMLILYTFWVFSWFFISFITYIHYLFSESSYKNPKVRTKIASCLDDLRCFILVFVV